MTENVARNETSREKRRVKSPDSRKYWERTPPTPENTRYIRPEKAERHRKPGI